MPTENNQKSGNELSLDAPYSLGEKNFSILKEHLDGMFSGNIIEFGSGISTLRLAKEFPNAKIHSYEDSKNFYLNTKNILLKYRIENAVVELAPLHWEWFGVRSYFCYQCNYNSMPKDIGFTLVDGPVEKKNPRGREACLYQIFERISVGGIIMIDDYHRLSAKKIVSNWLATYKSALTLVAIYPDSAIMRKEKTAKGTFPGIRSLCDNYINSIPAMARSGFRRLARRIHISIKK